MQLGVFEVLGGGCVQGTRLGRPLRPLPLCARGRDRRRLGLVTELPPAPSGGRACLVPSPRRGGQGSSPPPRRRRPPIPRHFTRVSGVRVCMCVCVCVCVRERARMAVLLSAKCFLGAAPRGGGGAPAACRAFCLCDCLVCTRFEPSARLSPPSPIGKFTGNLFPA